MKKFILFIYFFCIFQIQIIYGIDNMDQTLLWEKTLTSTIGGSNTCIVEMIDENYMFGGTYAENTSKKNIIIYKINNNGDILWEKSYGVRGGSLSFTKIITTNDNNYLILGNIDKGEPKVNDFYLLKINEKGDVLFNKTIGDTDQQISSSVIQTNKGNIIIIGYSYTRSSNSEFPWPINVIKMDKNGNIIWEKEFGDKTMINEGSEIIEIETDKYVCVGQQKTRTLTPSYVGYVFCLNSDGIILSEKYYNDYYIVYIKNIFDVNDGIILIYSKGTLNDLANGYIMKIDYNLNTVWNKKISFTTPVDMMQFNSNFVICGLEVKLNPVIYNAVSIISDQNNNEIAKIYLSPGYNNIINSLLKVDDGYFLTGEKYNISSDGIYYANTVYQLYLAKIKVTTSIEETKTSTTTNIPGFPYVSLIIGFILTTGIFFLIKKKLDKTFYN